MSSVTRGGAEFCEGNRSGATGAKESIKSSDKPENIIWIRYFACF